MANLGVAFGEALPDAFNKLQGFAKSIQDLRKGEQDIATAAQAAEIARQGNARVQEEFEAERPIREYKSAVGAQSLKTLQEEIARDSKVMDINRIPADSPMRSTVDINLKMAQDIGIYEPGQTITRGDMKKFEAEIVKYPQVIKSRYKEAYDAVTQKIQSMQAPLKATQDKLVQLQAEYETTDVLTQKKIKGQIDKYQAALMATQKQLSPLQEQAQSYLQMVHAVDTEAKMQAFMADNADAIASMPQAFQLAVRAKLAAGDTKGATDVMGEYAKASVKAPDVPSELVQYEMENGVDPALRGTKEYRDGISVWRKGKKGGTDGGAAKEYKPQFVGYDESGAPLWADANTKQVTTPSGEVYTGGPAAPRQQSIPTGEQADRLASFESVYDTLDWLEKNYKPEYSGVLDASTGALTQYFNADEKAFRQNFADALNNEIFGKGGKALTATEKTMVSQAIGSLFSSDKSFKKGIKTWKDTLRRNQENYKEALRQGGRRINDGASATPNKTSGKVGKSTWEVVD